jgi:GNAT superfamily N-acetyltransferase
MPAMLDDPSSPTIYRTSGSAPFPDPHDAQPALPGDVYPRQVTLRDRVTIATIVPFSSRHQVPSSLLAYLSDQLDKEIEMGDTYPMIDPMGSEKFSSYWFQNFGAVMLMGNIKSADEIVEGKDWATECLGSFYIKPNYPGRSSHICNAGFLVTDAARNKGVGRLMGESYLEWAPRLGYTYSVFNLVYETNVASCKIWDALGFKRIGRVKGAGNLKSYPGQLIDAIIYGRDLGPEGNDFVSEERFDKITSYLRSGKYPAGADRAEKSRLRSAATHYKLLDNDKLMLKDKEVIADPTRQYETARKVHDGLHAGINKTTALIAEKYHWIRIKETVSQVIKNCTVCKELGKNPVMQPEGSATVQRKPLGHGGVGAAGRVPLSPPIDPSFSNHQPPQHDHHQQHHQTSVSPQVLNRTLPGSVRDPHPPHTHPSQLRHPSAAIAQMQNRSSDLTHNQSHSQTHHQQQNIREEFIPMLMEDVRSPLGTYGENDHTSHEHAPTFDPHDGLDHQDGGGGDDSFQAMLGSGGGGSGTHETDGDLDMLIDQEDDGEGEEDADESVLRIQAEAAARIADEAMGSGRRGYGKG